MLARQWELSSRASFKAALECALVSVAIRPGPSPTARPPGGPMRPPSRRSGCSTPEDAWKGSPTLATTASTHSTRPDRITNAGGGGGDRPHLERWAHRQHHTRLVNPTVQFACDGAGNLTGISDARGHAWAFTDDAQHRLLSERARRGTVVLSTAYDGPRRVAPQTDAAGQVSTFGSAALNGGRRQVVVAPPSGNAITQVYGANGRLLRVIDGERNTPSLREAVSAVLRCREEARSPSPTPTASRASWSRSPSRSARRRSRTASWIA